MVPPAVGNRNKAQTLAIASLLVAKCMSSPIMQSAVNGVLSQTSSLSLLTKGFAAIIGIAVIYLAFRVLERKLPQHFGQANVRYRARKFIVFCGYVTVFLFLAILFEDRLAGLALPLGSPAQASP